MDLTIRYFAGAAQHIKNILHPVAESEYVL
jgi:hypothetical protein